MGTASIVEGSAKVGDTNAPDFTISPALETGAVTKRKQSRQILADDATTAPTFTIFDSAEIANANFLYVKARNASGIPVFVNLEITGAAKKTFAIDVTDFIWAIESSGAQCTKCVVFCPTSHGDVYVDYVVAGN